MKRLITIVIIVLFISLLVYLPILIYFFKSGCFLFSKYSGLLLINIVFCFCFLLVFKIIQIKKNNNDYIKNPILLLFTVYFIVMVIEMSLRLSSGDHNFDESRNGYYMSRNLKNTFVNNGRLHLWQTDHYLNSPGEFSYYRKINSESLSENEIPLKKDTNEIRIIGLGDSFTEGFGTPYDSTWLKQLENKLNNSQTKKYYSTINAGVTGSDPVFEFVLLNDRLLKYKPDIVVYDINYTDTYDILLRGGFERFDINGNLLKPEYVWWEWIFASSYSFRYIMLKVLSIDYFSLKRSDEKTRIRSLEIIKHVLINTYTISLLEHFKLIICFQPLSRELKEKKFYADFSTLINYFINNYPNVIIVNLLDIYLNEYGLNNKNIQDYYWKIDGHHNSKGYGIKADAIYESLLKKNIIQQ